MRKCLAFAMIVIMLCSATCLASADTQYTVQLKAGEIFGDTMPASFYDILEALKFVFTYNNDALAATVAISGTDVTSLIVKPDTDGIFLSNDIIADKPLYISYNDLAAISEQLMKDSGMSNPAELFSMDDVMQDESLMSFIDDVMNRTVTEEGEFIFDEFDAADIHVSLELTTQDFIKIFESQTIRSCVDWFSDFLRQSDSMDDAEAFVTDFNKMITSLKNGKATISTNTDLYMNGSSIVKMQISEKQTYRNSSQYIDFYFSRKTLSDTSTDYKIQVNVKEDDDETETMNILYHSEYVNNKRNDTLTVSVLEDGKQEDQMNGSFVMEETADGKLVSAKLAISSEEDHDENLECIFHLNAQGNSFDSFFGMLVDGEQISFVTTQVGTDNGYHRNIKMYTRRAVALLEPISSDVPAFEFIIEKNEVNSSILQTLNHVTASECLQPTTMSNSQIEQLANEIAQRAFSKFYSCISLLPTSAMTLFMN